MPWALILNQEGEFDSVPLFYITSQTILALDTLNYSTIPMKGFCR